MSHLTGKLTKRKIESLDAPGRYGDGNGLYLVVSPGGSKAWVLRTTVRGIRTDLGLGGYSYTPLQEARQKALEKRAVARNGGDPSEQNNKNIPTFGELTEEVYNQRKDTWKNAKHAQGWINSMRQYAFPTLADRPVDQIETSDVLGVLTPIWTNKSETARRVMQRMRVVLDVAKASGYRRGENPVSELSNGDILPKVSKKQKHFEAMRWQDVPAFYVDLSTRSAMAAKALMFTCLTGSRTGEVIGAQWDEFDFDELIWTVPDARMKTGDSHRVPLTDAMLDIVEPLKQLGSKYVFEGQKRHKPLSNMAMLMLLRRMKVEGVTVHGFRSSFRDWSAEVAKAPREVAELSLSHRVGSEVERAYARTDLLDRRRQLMASWSDYVTGRSSNVVKIAT